MHRRTFWFDANENWIDQLFQKSFGSAIQVYTASNGIGEEGFGTTGERWCCVECHQRSVDLIGFWEIFFLILFHEFCDF